MTPRHHQSRHTLSRAVRFSINTDNSTQGSNSTTSKPSLTTLGRSYQITLTLIGTPDPTTGYILGIQHLDNIVRTHLASLIARAIETNPHQHPTTLLPDLFTTAQSNLPTHLNQSTSLHALTWELTPHHEITMTTESTDTIQVQQQYEFAAAHRLHAPSLSDTENASFFGKCNNPAGHGHNYKLTPTILIPLHLTTNPQLHLDIESAVNAAIIDPLDHKFLNTDCPPFDQSKAGQIPSVENITTHCYNTLKPHIENLGCTLKNITLWETDRTSSTYPAP